MYKIQFFLGKSKGADFKVKRPMIVEESKVQSDYTENDPSAPSHILNRPFCDLRKKEPMDITFDGDLTGREVVIADFLLGANYVKLTDVTPSKEEFLAGGLTLTSDGLPPEQITASFSEIEMVDLAEQGVPALAFVADIPICMVAYEDGRFEGIDFTKGTYGVYVGEQGEATYVSQLSLPSVLSGEIKKLDNKFIDAEWMATVQRKEMVLFPKTIVESGRSYALGNEMPSYPVKAKVVFDDDTTYICNVAELYGIYQYFGNLAIMGEGVDTGEPFLCLVYGMNFGVILSGDISVPMSVSVVYNDYEKLPPEFLPDGIGSMPLMVKWDKNDLDSVYIALRDGWQAGRTVILYDVANVDQLRLLFFDGDDPDIWRASFVDVSGALYYLYFNGGWVYGSTDGFVKVISFGYSEYQEPESKTGQVLVGKDDGFAPALLNSTLTEGSTLPAQEGAVFTAIQGLENTIGTLNEDLENRLNGGT